MGRVSACACIHAEARKHRKNTEIRARRRIAGTPLYRREALVERCHPAGKLSLGSSETGGAPHCPCANGKIKRCIVCGYGQPLSHPGAQRLQSIAVEAPHIRAGRTLPQEERIPVVRKRLESHCEVEWLLMNVLHAAPLP